MNRSEIAALACRWLAMAMFALAGLTGAGSAAEFVVSRLSTTSVGQPVETHTEFLTPSALSAVGSTALIGGGVWLFFAWFYWQRAEPLAGKLVDDDPRPVTSSPVSSVETLATGCRLIGIVVLLYALRTGCGLALEFAFDDPQANKLFLTPGRAATLIQAILEAGLAAWFLFGTQGIVRLVAWARSAGTEPRGSHP